MSDKLSLAEQAELARLEELMAESPEPKGARLRGPKLPARRRRSKTRRDKSRARRRARAK